MRTATAQDSDKQGRSLKSLLPSYYYWGGKLVFAGNAGTGFRLQLGRQLVERLWKIERDEAPFAAVPRDYVRGSRWAEPKLVAEIAYGDWTTDGVMRRPKSIALRDDMAAREVRLKSARDFMWFKVPGHAVEFEIPDEWWEAADMPGFVPETEAYAAAKDPHEPSPPIPFSEILPPQRSAGTPRFKRDRIIQILEAIRAGTPHPPISRHGPVPDSEVPYAVRDGMHRYHAAAAAGFHAVSALVWPYWVPEE